MGFNSVKGTPRATETVSLSIFASAALAASGAYTRSSIISVDAARFISLQCDYDPHASSTAGYPMIVPLVSNADDEPAAGDDSWFQMPITDGTLTAGTLAGAVPSGADYTLAQDQGVVTVYGLAVRLAASQANTNEYRQAVDLDVTRYRWFHFIVGEVGDTTNPGTFSALYSLSA